MRGMKMPGHMGVDRITTLNLRVVSTDVERGLILVDTKYEFGRAPDGRIVVTVGNSEMGQGPRTALPMILANVTVPLVGFADSAAVGHLDDPTSLAVLASGTYSDSIGGAWITRSLSAAATSGNIGVRLVQTKVQSISYQALANGTAAGSCVPTQPCSVRPSFCWSSF